MSGAPAAPITLAVALVALAVGAGINPAAGQPTGSGSQEAVRPGAQAGPVEATHRVGLFRRVEREVHGALLAPDSRTRDRYLDAAEQLARHLVAEDTLSADALYWLAVVQGVRTEYSGPFQKLTSGKEVFFTTARVLELDSLHAGGHEMMGRLHSAVMRLPWVVRSLALRMGMGEALGEASWARAEAHYLRSAELDTLAIAPRLELSKLYMDRGRGGEARPVLAAMVGLPARTEVDRRMLEEGAALLARTAAGSPPVELPPPGPRR